MKKILAWGIVIGLSVVWIKYSLLSQVGECEEIQKNVEMLIEDSQRCSQDEDCTVLNLSCPFDCLTPVRKGTQKVIMASIGVYHDSCMPMCPDCPAKSPKVLRCIKQKCVAN